MKEHGSDDAHYGAWDGARGGSEDSRDGRHEAWDRRQGERGDSRDGRHEEWDGGRGEWERVEQDASELESRWPLHWQQLHPRERWLWFDQLWADACMLRERYRLALRSGWWEDQIQVEALAALAAWVALYDSGQWEDPPGKLTLLYDLERVSMLLRDGLEPFYPDRDRPAFRRYLIDSGCQPPPVLSGP